MDALRTEEEYRTALKFLSELKAKIASMTWLKQETEVIIKEWREKNTKLLTFDINIEE